MRSRIEQEQCEFDVSGARIHAVRSVHLKLVREVFKLLGTAKLKAEMAELTTALRQPGIKLGVKKAYGETFDRLREGLRKSQQTSAEIQSMLAGTFRQLNADYGFSLQAPREPELARYERDLDLVERSHIQYLGVANVSPGAGRVCGPAGARRSLRDCAWCTNPRWAKSNCGMVGSCQLDAQLRRRRNFTRRIEAIKHPGGSHGLNERIFEIEAQETVLASSMPS
jgi:hypothetical protein